MDCPRECLISARIKGMDLVDRFLTASEWSTAKKTSVMALGFWLPAQIIQYVAARAAVVGTTYFDVRWLDLTYAVLIPLSIVVGGVSAWVASRDHAGEWTFYVLVVPYQLVLASVLYAAGSGNAAVFVPLVLPFLVVAAWFDAGKALIVGSLVVATLLGLAAATLAGVPYAPAILERSIDAQASARVQLGGAAILAPAFVMGGVFVGIVGQGLRRDRARVVATRDQLDHAVALISRYVPAELASGILAGSERPDDGYRRQKVTVFFSDIVGFTDLAEELEPEDLARVLNEYFGEMTAIAGRHRGTVDELQGDGLIVLFGAPTHVSDREHALDAVAMASEMQEAIDRLNVHWQDAGIGEGVAVRMGINTGVVTVGHFGSGGRMKYTVIGKHVNLAARIQAACRPGRVLLSHATWLLVRDVVKAISLGDQEFKGIVRPVEVHELA